MSILLHAYKLLSTTEYTCCGSWTFLVKMKIQSGNICWRRKV